MVDIVESEIRYHLATYSVGLFIPTDSWAGVKVQPPYPPERVIFILLLIELLVRFITELNGVTRQVFLLPEFAFHHSLSSFGVRDSGIEILYSRLSQVFYPILLSKRISTKPKPPSKIKPPHMCVWGGNYRTRYFSLESIVRTYNSFFVKLLYWYNKKIKLFCNFIPYPLNNSPYSHKYHYNKSYKIGDEWYKDNGWYDS